jgi:ATP-dependent exoDNAse (exonuclease V) beta subunit
MFEPPKPEDNMESTERNTSERGRGGTSFGSAVHAVLQDVDFDDQENLIELVNSAAIAHDVPDAIDEIAASVRNVLASPVVAGANSRNSWREAWVAAEVSDGAEVEGSIDLVVSNDDGTVTIVDYKTDRVVGQDLIKRATGYEPQLAGYALVLEKLGMPVRDAVLVFANGGPDDSAYEYFVADLEAAKAAAVKQIVAKLG